MAFRKPVRGTVNERRNRVLQVIRQHPDSACKTLIQRETGMGMESTITMVQDLLREQMITDEGPRNLSAVGRRANVLRMNPDGCYFIGLRFNVEKIWGVLLDFTLQEIGRVCVPLPEGLHRDEVLQSLLHTAENLRAQLGDRQNRLCGLGIAAPGLNDADRGVCIRYVHISDWVNVPLQKYLEEHFHLPVVLEGSTRCLLMSIAKDNPGLKNALLLQMDRGVGSSILVDGHLFHGATNMAGNIGHLCVTDQPIRCECGRIGCLEAIAGSRAIIRRYRELIGETEAPEKTQEVYQRICREACIPNTVACGLLQEAGRAVGRAVYTAVTLLNPSHVILSGLPCEVPCFCATVQKVATDYGFPESMVTMDFSFQHYDECQGAIGAAYLLYLKQYGV